VGVGCGVGVGPADRTMSTCEPVATSVPEAGLLRMTVPSGWSEVSTDTRPSWRSAASRVSRASSRVWPARTGTITVSSPALTTTVIRSPSETCSPDRGSVEMTVSFSTSVLASGCSSSSRPSRLASSRTAAMGSPTQFGIWKTFALGLGSPSGPKAPSSRAPRKPPAPSITMASRARTQIHHGVPFLGGGGAAAGTGATGSTGGGTTGTTTGGGAMGATAVASLLAQPRSATANSAAVA